MSTAKPVCETTFLPQYFIIPRSEPQYDLIRNQLLASARSRVGSSHYFIRAARGKGCICRISDSRDTVLFYEILDHRGEGISDEDIREAVREPSGASPLPEYFYITPAIEEKLRVFLATVHAYCGEKCKSGSLA